MFVFKRFESKQDLSLFLESHQYTKLIEEAPSN